MAERIQLTQLMKLSKAMRQISFKAKRMKNIGRG
jgi:hypothetical protein